MYLYSERMTLKTITPAIKTALLNTGYNADTNTYTCPTTGATAPIPLRDYLRSTRGAILSGAWRSKRKTSRAKLLGKSSKIEKSNKAGTKTAVIYQSPHKEAGVNMCPMATKGCAAACLGHSSGQMVYPTSKVARIKRTLRWHLFPEVYLDDLRGELKAHQDKAGRLGMRCAVRLDGTSDGRWEKTGIMEEFPSLEFYDYTKFRQDQRPNLPANYHLTFSISDRKSSWTEAMQWLDNGGNAAMVVRSERQSRFIVAMGYRGYPVVNGDLTDIRMDDPPGHIVALYAKGAAIQDRSGFVKDIDMAIAIAAK